jgi:hypothetical protein
MKKIEFLGPLDRFVAAVGVELAVDVLDVRPDGAHRDKQVHLRRLVIQQKRERVVDEPGVDQLVVIQHEHEMCGDGGALTRKGDRCGVLLYRTGEMLYNDHDLGTPPLVVGLANLGTRRGVSSFLAWMCAISKWRTTYWRCAIIPVYARSVKLSSGCDAPAVPPRPTTQYDRSSLTAEGLSGSSHLIWLGLTLFRSSNSAYNTLLDFG